MKLQRAKPIVATTADATAADDNILTAPLVPQ
jgi:hypothetical protein